MAQHTRTVVLTYEGPQDWIDDMLSTFREGRHDTTPEQDGSRVITIRTFPESGDATIAAIKARCKAAPPGPWRKFHFDPWPCRVYGVEAGDETPVKVGDEGQGIEGAADAEFIAAARTDVPFLLSTVRRLKAELVDLRAEGAEIVRRHNQLCESMFTEAGELGRTRRELEDARAEVRRLRADLVRTSEEFGAETSKLTRTMATLNAVVKRCKEKGWFVVDLLDEEHREYVQADTSPRQSAS